MYLSLIVLAMATAPLLSAGPAAQTQESRMDRSTLRELAQRRGILIGAAVSTNAFGEARAAREQPYLDILARQFNILTPENAGKFANLAWAPGQYDWSTLDAMFDFAAKHDMKVRMHTGVWHMAVPKWIDPAVMTPAQIEQALKDHIFAVGKRYGDRMAYWDVVNEAIDDKTFGLRKTVWLEAIGPDYIAKAFRWAHQAAPKAKLVYNDYGIIAGGDKANAVLELVKQLKKQGVPVHAVGFQCHLLNGERHSRQTITDNLRRFSDLGVEVHITEMDVAIEKFEGDRAAQIQTQAQVYRTVLEAFLATPGATVFQMWGFTDRHSWVNNFCKRPTEAALIYDRDYQPKPALGALMDALAGR